MAGPSGTNTLRFRHGRCSKFPLVSDTAWVYDGRMGLGLNRFALPCQGCLTAVVEIGQEEYYYSTVIYKDMAM